MTSTSVHLPPGLLARLDRLAVRSGVSRNRLVVRALEEMVARSGGEWPADFFSNEHLSAADLAQLRKGAKELLESVRAGRRSKKAAPF